MRFTRAARKHRIGRAHAIHVMASTEPIVTVNDRGEIRYDWIGADARGLELEITAVSTVDLRTGEPILLILHVMPTDLRRSDS